jgi:kynurenine formamidase
MNSFDLSHTISPDMTIFPGAHPPGIHQESSVKKDGIAVKNITLGSHHGTHIDAPAHLFETLPNLDDFNIDRFFGEALCLAVTEPLVDSSFFEPLLDTLHKIDFLLFATGWSRFWGKESYFTGFPVLSERAARLLCTYNLKGVGFDTISADPVDSVELPIHRILLKKMIIVENLNNLEVLPQTPFFFSCLPLKIAEADGSPVRAIAICR